MGEKTRATFDQFMSKCLVTETPYQSPNLPKLVPCEIGFVPQEKSPQDGNVMVTYVCTGSFVRKKHQR